ncbi:uncharacterized protein IWZ02DRAFT_194954 [Phyllosticta citriasiana]|uniref:Uncharacterized protein n=1 Tax=Phyllosticta citriasiana TaxID=595635 RepID=A0ABR1KCI2_9PEZI
MSSTEQHDRPPSYSSFAPAAEQPEPRTCPDYTSLDGDSSSPERTQSPIYIIEAGDLRASRRIDHLRATDVMRLCLLVLVVACFLCVNATLMVFHLSDALTKTRANFLAAGWLAALLLLADTCARVFFPPPAWSRRGGLAMDSPAVASVFYFIVLLLVGIMVMTSLPLRQFEEEAGKQHD